ncbi:MAG: InlB B-repeat-containing protein [Candidatus Scatosoma sp.]
MKRINIISPILFVMAMCISLCFSVAACSVETLNRLVSDYGITVEGGGFEKGASLVTEIIETTGEKGRKIVSLLEDKEYDKDGEVSIYDIFVAKDGSEVQPNGKVKVTLSAPFESENGYVTFHVKDDDTVETLETTYAEGKISFETESFSCFVIAEDEKYYDFCLINVDGRGAVRFEGLELSTKGSALSTGRRAGKELPLAVNDVEDGYAFIGWYGSADLSNVWDVKYNNLLSTETTFNFTMPANGYVIYAVFRPVREYNTLGVINVGGRGTVGVDGVETSEESDLSFARKEGAKSVITAKETLEGYVFAGWYGTMDTSNVWALKYEVLLSAEKTFTFTMPAYDYIIYAVFKPAHTVYAFADKDAEGTITWGENNESAAAEVKVAEGKSVTLTAVPKEGYRFLGWYDEPKNENEQIGNLLCENAAYTVNVDDSDVNIYARFEKIPEPVTEEYPLTVGQQGAGGCVSINGDTASSPESSPYYENYAAGERIMLVAQTRSSEYIFKGWFEIDDTTLTHLVLKDTPVSTQLTYSFDMPENGYTVYAVFEAVVTSLSLDGANAGFSGGTATYTIGDEYKPNPENVVVSGVTAEGNLFLTAGVDYSIDLGGLNFEVAGVYTVTYTYLKKSGIAATLTIVVEGKK